jgi:hypothetical protein
MRASSDSLPAVVGVVMSEITQKAPVAASCQAERSWDTITTFHSRVIPLIDVLLSPLSSHPFTVLLRYPRSFSATAVT